MKKSKLNKKKTFLGNFWQIFSDFRGKYYKFCIFSPYEFSGNGWIVLKNILDNVLEVRSTEFDENNFNLNQKMFFRQNYFLILVILHNILGYFLSLFGNFCIFDTIFDQL